MQQVSTAWSAYEKLRERTTCRKCAGDHHCYRNSSLKQSKKQRKWIEFRMARKTFGGVQMPCLFATRLQTSWLQGVHGLPIRRFSVWREFHFLQALKGESSIRHCAIRTSIRILVILPSKLVELFGFVTSTRNRHMCLRSAIATTTAIALKCVRTAEGLKCWENLHA